METRMYVQMLRRGWWIILVAMLTALAVALGASYVATPKYTSVARFILTPSNALVNRADVLNGLGTLNSQSVMATYAEVVNSDHIRNDTRTFLQLQPDDMKSYVYAATVVSNSTILELHTTGPDAQTAARIANAVGYQTIAYANSMNQVFTLAFLDTASPPATPSSPQPLLNAGLALALGAVVGVAMAILSEQLATPLDAYRQRAHLDKQTGVFNRQYFSRTVEEEMPKDPLGRLCLGIVELTGLRDLFETLPLAELRRVLHDVCETLRRELRGNDVIGRWTDISFGVLLPGTPGTAAKSIFDRILVALSKPVSLDPLGVAVSLDPHIGGAAHRENMSAAGLFESANAALEQARQCNDAYVQIITTAPEPPT